MTVAENLAFPLKNRGMPRDEDLCAGCGDRAAARPDAVSRPQGDAADGGRQAEDLARPRPRAARRGGDPVRRTADRDRSAPEVGAALEAEGAAPRARPDDDLRDPRPDRGADLRRHGGRHAGRPGRAERHAAGAVREARAYLRRLLHRLAGHEHPAGRRAGPARAPVGPPDRAAAQLRQASARREDRDRRAPGIRDGRGSRGRPAERACRADRRSRAHALCTRARRRAAARGACPERHCASPAATSASISIPRTFTSMRTAGWSRERPDGEDRQPESVAAGAAGVRAGRVLGDRAVDDGRELFGAGHVRQQPVLLERRRLVQGPARSVDRARRPLLRVALAQPVLLRRRARDRDPARHPGGAVDAARRLARRRLPRSSSRCRC